MEISTGSHGTKCRSNDANISLFNSRLDKVLDLRLKSFVELTGMPGVGKTQFAMQLAVHVATPKHLCGVEGDVIIIDTEGGISPSRLRYFASFISKANLNCVTEKDILKKIYIKRILTLKKLIKFTTKLISMLRSRDSIKLIILDSMTFHFRYGFAEDESRERLASIKSIAETLRFLTKRFNVCVICINQMTTKFENNVGQVVPCLGKTWTSFLDKRIILSRLSEFIVNSNEVEIALRQLVVYYLENENKMPDSAEFYISQDRIVSENVSKVG